MKRTIKGNLDEDNLDAARPATSSPDGSATNGRSATASEPAPSASEPLPADEVREISRSLGRGLAELRRAREEVQRSFRVDLTEPVRRTQAPTADVPADGKSPEPDRPSKDQAAG